MPNVSSRKRKLGSILNSLMYRDLGFPAPPDDGYGPEPATKIAWSAAEVSKYFRTDGAASKYLNRRRPKFPIHQPCAVQLAPTLASGPDALSITNSFTSRSMFELKPQTTAVKDALIASYGHALPKCPRCGARMVMSCREAWPSEPLIFTFECRGCSSVMQRVKAPGGADHASPAVCGGRLG